MTIDDLKKRLATARQRLERAMQALRATWRGGEEADYWAAEGAVLKLERELAAARGEEHAVPLDFPLRWDVGCPRPHLVCNDYKTLLAFIIREPRRAVDGRSVEVVDPGDGAGRRLALVEFRSCYATKLGAPNDEVFHGHPLEGRGLEAYTAQKVVNSRWLSEIEAINKVHHRYDPSRWGRLNHYVFWFHDTTFECLAESYTVEEHRESVEAMLARMCRRLL